jgi:hypothetical protein
LHLIINNVECFFIHFLHCVHFSFYELDGDKFCSFFLQYAFLGSDFWEYVTYRWWCSPFSHHIQCEYFLSSPFTSLLVSLTHRNWSLSSLFFAFTRMLRKSFLILRSNIYSLIFSWGFYFHGCPEKMLKSKIRKYFIQHPRLAELYLLLHVFVHSHTYT